MRADPNSYGNDVIAWANEQAWLLRAGRFEALDIEQIADEIEDVDNSEQRDLRNSVWWSDLWSAAVSKASDETGLGDFPEACPRTFEEIMNPEFWPTAVD